MNPPGSIDSGEGFFMFLFWSNLEDFELDGYRESNFKELEWLEFSVNLEKI